MHLKLFLQTFTLYLLITTVLCAQLPLISQPMPSTCLEATPLTSTSFGMGNCYNNQYYIQLQIGTPPQTIGLLFDTGSNQLWVPLAGVTGFSGTTFNGSDSSSFNNTSIQNSIQYGVGAVYGTMGSDVVSLPSSNFNVTFPILWVNQVDQLELPPQISGTVGMGHVPTPNFLDLAYQQGSISSPLFALQLLQQPQQSILYFDQIPQSISQNTFWVPSPVTTWWAVNLLGVTVGGLDMTQVSGGIGVIDSGTSVFNLNQELYWTVVNQFFWQCQNTLYCPCQGFQWPTFELILQGIVVYIYPQNYTYALQNSTLCGYNFGSSSIYPTQLLLGDTLMRNYIITFDKLNWQVGFNGADIVTLGNPYTQAIQDVTYVFAGVLVVLFVFGIVASVQMASDVNERKGQSEQILQGRRQSVKEIQIGDRSSMRPSDMEKRLIG